jgi:UMF1 family MFS transporter
MAYGLITWLSAGNQRLAIGATSLLFLLGWVLLMRVDVARGRLAAQAPA